ncbi:hypothetical protein I4U23_015315 [Adineta vaga]|nr:hypothetical protein I4U23_015315 [Adineta vaga]
MLTNTWQYISSTFAKGKHKHDNQSKDNTPQQSLQIVQHSSQPYIVLSDRQHREDLSKDPMELDLSEKLVYGDAGYFVRNDSEQWQPLYNLYEDETKYYLVLEASGFQKGQLSLVSKSDCIIIEGTRSDMNKSMVNPTIHKSDIPIGSFRLEIPFKSEIDLGPKALLIERDDGFIRLTIMKKKVEEFRPDI